MYEELKRCPFCGELPLCGVERYESWGDGATRLKAVVKCTCGISKGVVFTATEPTSLVPFYKYENAFDEAIKKWNTRN